MSLILSVEIDNNGIKITEASKKGKLLSILKCFSLTAATGVEDGRIIDSDFIVNLIKEGFVKNNIKAKKAVFVINSGCVMIRKMKLPRLNKKSEILSMVRFELEQMISADLSRYKIIYKVIDEACENDVKNAFYVIYCLPEDIYYGCKNLARKLKLKLVYIDVSFNCLNKIYAHDININGNLPDLENIYAFVNINFQFISFCVLNKGINDFSRISLYNKEEGSNEAAAETQASYNEGSHDLSLFVNKVLDEISKYIRYYYSIDNSNYINKLYIYGCHSKDKNMSKFLSDNLRIEIEAINRISNIQFECTDKKLSLDESFISILSLFNYKNDICFSADNLAEHVYDSKLFPAAISAALIIMLSVLLAFRNYNIMLENKIGSMSLYIDNADNTRRNAEVENLKEDIILLENYLEQTAKLKNLINHEDYVSAVIFREIFYAIPQNTKVTSMSVDRNGTQLFCFSESMEEAALFLQNLREIDFIDEVHLPSIEVLREGDRRYSYSIMCKLKDVSYFDK